MARMTKKAANELFDSLHEQIVDIEKTIIRIIETRAWEVLGYESFADAWKDRLSSIPLATKVMKAHVVYALLDTQTPEEIGGPGGASGVSIDAARSLKRQKSAGVPANLASGRTRGGVEPKASPLPRTVRIVVDTDEYKAWTSVAAAAGETLDEYAGGVLRDHFSRPAAVRRLRRVV